MARRRGTLNKQAIVAYAATICDEAGDIRAVTLKDIAAHFDVKVPSLYNHIQNLSALEHAVSIYATRRIYAALQSSAVGVSADDALRSMAHAFRQFATDHPGLYPLTIAAPQPDDTEREEVSTQIIELMQAVLRPYGLSEEDSLHTIRVFRSLLHGFVDIERRGGFGLPLATDATFETLMRMFLEYLPSE